MLHLAVGLCLAVTTIHSAGCSFTPKTGEAFHAHRASFATDTATVDEGGIELEVGVNVDPRRKSVDTPTTLYYGVASHLDAFVQVSPLQFQSQPGRDATRFGDTILGSRFRFVDQGRINPSLGFQLQAKLPTGDDRQGLSSGEFDLNLGWMMTRDFEGFATTLYYDLGILGDPGGGSSLEHSVAVFTEYPVTRTTGLFTEIVGVFPVEDGPDSYLANCGASFHLYKTLAWDLGASFGLDGDAPDIQFFLGLTWGIGQFVRHRH